MRALREKAVDPPVVAAVHEAAAAAAVAAADRGVHGPEPTISATATPANRE
jgi:hypothetical protein